MPYVENGQAPVPEIAEIAKRLFEWKSEGPDGKTVEIIDLDKIVTLQVSTSGESTCLLKVSFSNGQVMEKSGKSLAKGLLNAYRAYRGRGGPGG